MVSDWESEKAGYNYATDTCSGVCGHYTQLVWRESVELGCGVTTCQSISGLNNGPGEFWVCRYRDAGNFTGRKPY